MATKKIVRNAEVVGDSFTVRVYGDGKTAKLWHKDDLILDLNEDAIRDLYDVLECTLAEIDA